MAVVIWVKDPVDVAWFKFDWSDFLDPGDSIVSASAVVDSFSTLISTVVQSTAVLIRVSGGTAGTVSEASCSVVTALGGTYAFSKAIHIKGRSTS